MKACRSALPSFSAAFLTVALVAAALVVTPAAITPATAAGSTAKPLKIVQLGDSYSAGNGAGS